MGTMAPESFLKSVQEDPLFAAQGMDLERGEAAVQRISDVVGEIEAAISSSSFRRHLFIVRYPILRSIVPFSFITSFIESERCRRRFLAYPSVEEGRRLLDSWKRTQRYFEKGVGKFSKMYALFSGLAGDAARNPIQDMHGNVTTHGDFEKQVKALKENASALRREIADRRLLLYGEKKEWLRRAQMQKSLEYIPGGIPAKYARIHELEMRHGFQIRDATVEEVHGPFVYTLKNFDGTPTAHTFMLCFLRNNESGIGNLKLTSVDLFNFLKIEKHPAKDPHMRTHAYIVDTGMTYWYQSATNFYTARDQQYWADIATVVDSVRRPEMNTEAVWRQKSSLLDLLLGTCAEDHRATLGNLREYLYRGVFSPAHAFSLFMMRANPSIYFLPFNGSVWRLDAKPDFLGSGRVKPEDVVYERADTILDTIPQEQLELAMRGGRIREGRRNEHWKAADVE